MEYFRQPDGKIQASFALNAGRLLSQYIDQAKKLPQDQRYEGTQTICVLHALLCHTVELVKSMRQIHRCKFDLPLPEVGAWLGIEKRQVVKYTFLEPITNFLFLEHLRNSLSHPTHPEKDPGHPSTGYTTIKGKTGLVESFCFVDSPWICRGKFMSQYRVRDKAKLEKTLEQKEFANKYGCLAIVRDESGFWQFEDGNGLFFPLFEARILLVDLIQLTLKVSNFLAQPIREDWDGRSVVDLLEAA